MKVSSAIEQVLEYLFYSEMEGRVDETDSWYSTYLNLLELKEKILNEEDS